MKWTKKNILVIICGVIYALILAGVGYLVFGQYQRLQEARSKHETLKPSDSASSYSPSQKNQEIAKANLNSLQSAEKKLMDAFPPEDINIQPDETQLAFTDHLRYKFCDRLKQEADKKRIILGTGGASGAGGTSQDFAFGFSSYLTAKGIVQPQDVKPLLQQMSVVEQLVGYLFDCKVVRIESIKRTGVGSEVEGGATPFEGRSGEPRASGAQQDLLVAESSTSGYDEKTFELKFAADNDSLQRFLNLLAESYRDNKRLFFVRQLQTQTVDASTGQSLSGTVSEYGRFPGEYSRVPYPTGSSVRPTTPAQGNQPLVKLTGNEKVSVILRVVWVQIGAKPAPIAPPKTTTLNPATTPATTGPRGQKPPESGESKDGLSPKLRGALEP